MGRFLYDAKVGLYASGILSTFLYLFVLGRLNLLDIPLTFFVSAATWGGFRYFAEETRRRRWICLFYGAAALAFLTKGVIGILFPPAIVGLWLLLQKRWRDVFGLFSLPGIALFLVIAAPWIVLVQKANSGFLHYFFIEEHLQRYATNSYGRVSVFYYLPVLLFGTLPWLAHLIRIFLERRGEGAALLKACSHPFLLVWAGFILLFFSISSAKIVTYIAPVFLPLAVMFGHIFRGHEEREADRTGGKGRCLLPRLPVLIQALVLFISMLSGPFLPEHAVPGREWWPLVAVPIVLVVLTSFPRDEDDRKGWFPVMCVLWALLLGTTLFPLSRYLTSYKSSFPVAQAVRELLPAREELYQYRIYLRGINYYCKIRTPIVGRADELEGKKRSLPADEKARYFLTRAGFYERCRQKGGLYCITKTGDMVDELRAKAGRVTVIWKNSAYCLLRLDCD
jgi:4-amino-4-deoxy-L-arabinose transferase-like glycosyltransferase